jgi:Uma2 family endonuclease
MTAQLVRDVLLSPNEYLEGELLSEVKREYVCGLVYPRADTRNDHNSIAGNVLFALFTQLRGKPCRPYNSDTKVRLRLPTGLRFYYPDVQVTCHPNPPDDTFQDNPVVIVEVISESTRRTDEGEKLHGYCALPSVENYLLVEPDRALVIGYRRTRDGFARDVHSGLDAVIVLPAIEAALPLAEIYERVVFPPPEAP